MQDWQAIRNQQIAFFKEGKTLSIEERKNQLKSMRQLLTENEKELAAALKKDFNKPEFECFITEIHPVLNAIQEALENLYSWEAGYSVALDQRIHFWSSAKLQSQPKGNALILAPWNYPINLVFHPMVGAIAAGCTVIFKPSENVPQTAALIQSLCKKYFPAEWVYCVTGDAETAKALLKPAWDHIFFTGSTKIGREVMLAAANNLSPVTLELGGKCPVIVDKKANLKVAAKRIAWAKLLNAGQTCVAPDHVWVDASIQSDFLLLLKQELQWQYAHLIKEDSATAIVNLGAFDRLIELLQEVEYEKLGEIERDRRLFPPCLVINPNSNVRLNKEEIFGPILPIFAFTDPSEPKRSIERNDHPLAIYLFGHSNKEMNGWQRDSRSGALLRNELIMHLGSEHLPFGGIGKSGMGRYHGKAGFDTFSIQRSIMTKITWLDLPIRYAPYGSKLKWIKKLL